MKMKYEKEVKLKSEVRIQQFCPHCDKDQIGTEMRMPVILTWGGDGVGLMIKQVGEPYCGESCQGKGHGARGHHELSTQTDLAFMLGRDDFDLIAETISEKLLDDKKLEKRLESLREAVEVAIDESDFCMQTAVRQAVSNVLKPTTRRKNK